jgi:hypothetical protein
MSYTHKVEREDDLTWTVCGMSVDNDPHLSYVHVSDGRDDSVSCPWCITGDDCPKARAAAGYPY